MPVEAFGESRARVSGRDPRQGGAWGLTLEGLFAGEEEADLPAKASAALDSLGQLRAMMASVYDVIIDESKPATPSDIATTMKHLRELTLAMELEINRVVLDCTRAL